MNLTEVYGGTTLLMNQDSITGFPAKVVAWINSFLQSIWPGHLLWIVALISMAIGYLIMKKMNAGFITWLIITAVFYLAFRAIGIGGAA